MVRCLDEGQVAASQPRDSTPAPPKRLGHRLADVLSSRLEEHHDAKGDTDTDAKSFEASAEASASETSPFKTSD